MGEIVKSTEIEGLVFERNHFFDTGEGSRILIPSEGSLFTTIVYHAPKKNDEWSYPFFALHLSGDDKLTYINPPLNGGKIIGEFVDCRANSPTLHKRIRIEFDADPDVSLKIPAGVAHLFMNLAGVVTRNEPVLRWDPEPDKLFSPIADILNVSANAKDEEFPVVRPHRYVVPLSYHQYIASLHRKWSERVKVYPVRLVIKDKSYYIIPKEYGSNYVSKFTSNLSKNSI